MKILLLGECSNLHWTLAQGVRSLGHDVTVISDGSKWMNNARDIDLKRKGYGIADTLKYMFDIYQNLDKMRGYDIVQIKNPLFMDMKVERNWWLYKYLKKHNKKVFLGAFGTDYFWIKACFDKQSFRYSDYFIGDCPTHISLADNLAKEWIGTKKQEINIRMAETCDGIIACLYEYYMAYEHDCSEKLTFIPEPINTAEFTYRNRNPEGRKIRFFIGIQTDRNQLKGTDVMYEALRKLQERYPEECEIVKVESVPYQEYVRLMNQSDVLLDQLYSYTPGMNAFAAMAQGLVVVGGGEPEMYQLLNETENRPIINVTPHLQDVYNKLEWLVQNKDKISAYSLNSRLFVEKHHDYIKVAHQYLNAWAGS